MRFYRNLNCLLKSHEASVSLDSFLSCIFMFLEEENIKSGAKLHI